MKRYFVTAIGTDSGKTVVSSILCKATGFAYWKPVQAGIDETDINSVTKLVPGVKTFDEAYRLKEPMSPHAAAKIDDVVIDPSGFEVPKEDLVIEGAGGIMVPLRNDYFIADLIEQIGCEVILVSNLYLGSINHTLLTVNELKRRQIIVAGIIFNGPSNEESESLILEYSGYKKLLSIDQEPEISSEVIAKYAEQINL